MGSLLRLFSLLLVLGTWWVMSGSPAETGDLPAATQGPASLAFVSR